MKKEFTLNGTKITTLKKFYEEVEKELIVDANAIESWSLDILDDIFSGGYGVYNLKDEISIKWINFRRSKDKFKPEILESIIGIFRSHENVYLMIE